MLDRDRVLKVDEEKRLVVGEVYAPDIPDTDGDFMGEEEIEKMAHGFLVKMGQKNVDRNHDREHTGSVVVESFIARTGDPDFIPGSWVVAVKILDEALWEGVKKGEFNGFSMDAWAKKQTVEVEMEFPEVAEGFTAKSAGDGHTHRFFVRFSEDGDFLGGKTNEVDGHAHEIKNSTITNETDGHTHRYSYVEALIA